MIDEYIYSMLYVLFLVSITIIIYQLFTNYYQSKEVSTKTIFYSSKISGVIGQKCEKVPDPSYYIKIPIYNKTSDDVDWYCINSIEMR